MEHKENPMPPSGDESEPLGDRGHIGTNWSPEQGRHGIADRKMDDDPQAENATDPSKD